MAVQGQSSFNEPSRASAFGKNVPDTNIIHITEVEEAVAVTVALAGTVPDPNRTGVVNPSVPLALLLIEHAIRSS